VLTPDAIKRMEAFLDLKERQWRDEKRRVVEPIEAERARRILAGEGVRITRLPEDHTWHIASSEGAIVIGDNIVRAYSVTLPL
jgi:hypothetical protein